MRRQHGTDGETLTIGRVAKAAGVNVETLRYYERRGIIRAPRRNPSGYRAFPADTVAIIRFIKGAQELGFTLEEAQELLELRRVKGMKRDQVRAMAKSKLRTVEEKLAQLAAMRAAVATLLESCACSEDSVTCPILESLEHVAAGRPSSTAAGNGRGRANMKTVQIPIEGMSCEGCVSRITKAISALPGVARVEVDLRGRQVHVRVAANGSTVDGLVATLNGLGYTASVPVTSE